MLYGIVFKEVLGQYKAAGMFRPSILAWKWVKSGWLVIIDPMIWIVFGSDPGGSPIMTQYFHLKLGRIPLVCMFWPNKSHERWVNFWWIDYFDPITRLDSGSDLRKINILTQFSLSSEHTKGRPKGRPFACLELVKGIEPPTCSLRMSCSTIEPH